MASPVLSSNQAEPSHIETDDGLLNQSEAVQIEANQHSSVPTLASLLDALVLPEDAVHDHLKRSMMLPSNLPDIDARRQALRTLLSQIRPAEVRFLKQELCAKTFETDGIPLLPENVLAHIALDLDIVDLVRFRRVSKKWKMAWEIAPVYKDLLRKYSYVSYEKVYKSLPHDSPLLKELFDSRAERIDALRCGRVASVFTVPFDSGNKMGRGPASTVYHAGRIARMVNSNSAVVVVNLRSYESKTYQTAQRVGLTNYQLSSTHLVGTSFRNMLYAWSLIDHTATEVRLPLRPKSYHVHEDRVGIVLENQELLIWNIGGALRSLNCPTRRIEQGIHSFTHHAILFDPVCRSNATVISSYYESENEHRFRHVTVAQLYSPETEPKHNHEINWSDASAISEEIVYKESSFLECTHLPPSMSMTVEAVSGGGDYIILPYWSTPPHDKTQIIGYTWYKMHDRRFSEVNYLYPSFSHSGWRAYTAWNGILYMNPSRNCITGNESDIETIFGLKPIIGYLPDSGAYRTYNSTTIRPLRGVEPPAPGEDPLLFRWDRSCGNVGHPAGQYNVLFADEDFVVAFSSEEAVIYCYDKGDDLTQLGGVRADVKVSRGPFRYQISAT